MGARGPRSRLARCRWARPPAPLRAAHGWSSHAAAPKASPEDDRGGLTAREVEVLGLLAAAWPTAEVAEGLFTPGTVHKHAQRIHSKLGVHSRVEAARAAHAGSASELHLG